MVCLDGRFRRGVAVHVPDGRARASVAGAQVPAAAHRYTQIDPGSWRMLRLHLLRARRRWLSDVRRHAGTDLRPAAEPGIPKGTHGVLPPGRHRAIEADGPGGL